MSDLLSTLRENYELEPDLSTIKGILKFTELWLSGKQDADPTQLCSACAKMDTVLAQAVADTQADLSTTGKTHRNLAKPVEDMVKAYRQLQEILLDLGEAADKQDTEEAGHLLGELRESADFLRGAQEDLERWLQDDRPRCPRCGAFEHDPCPSCGLQLMHLDSSGGSEIELTPTSLPSEFTKLYAAIFDIRDGKVSLSRLFDVLPTVERNMDLLLSTLRAAQRQNDQSGNLAAGEACLMEIRSGLTALRAAADSRRMTELQQAWIQVFREAARMQEIRRSLIEEFGNA